MWKTIYLTDGGKPIITFSKQQNGLWYRHSDRERNLTDAQVIEEIIKFLKGKDAEDKGN